MSDKSEETKGRLRTMTALAVLVVISGLIGSLLVVVHTTLSLYCLALFVFALLGSFGGFLFWFSDADRRQFALGIWRFIKTTASSRDTLINGLPDEQILIPRSEAVIYSTSSKTFVQACDIIVTNDRISFSILVARAYEFGYLNIWASDHADQLSKSDRFILGSGPTGIVSSYMTGIELVDGPADANGLRGVRIHVPTPARVPFFISKRLLTPYILIYHKEAEKIVSIFSRASGQK